MLTTATSRAATAAIGLSIVAMTCSLILAHGLSSPHLACATWHGVSCHQLGAAAGLPFGAAGRAG